MGAEGDRPIPDDEIVRRVLAGDRNLFEVLVRRYQHKLLHYLYRTVRDRDLAEDLAQVAFVKAYTALATYDPTYRFSTWLYRIASNAAVDHHRRQRLRAVSLDQPLDTGDGELFPELPDGEPGPEARTGRRELAEILGRSVDRLPPSYRELILLRHHGECSYEEIVAVTGLPMGTVKNRLFRARAMLRAILEETEPEVGPDAGEFH